MKSPAAQGPENSRQSVPGSLARDKPQNGVKKYAPGTNGPASFASAGTSPLPNTLKNGLEALSGIDLSEVSVHFNSAKPAQLSAHAYAQGSQIHLAPGQERLLPHEAWHIVQQKQGRVPATTQFAGKPGNSDEELEQEAYRMGEKALQAGLSGKTFAGTLQRKTTWAAPVQRARMLRVPSNIYEPDGYVRYVLVDVPPDGSCLLSSLNLGEFADAQRVILIGQGNQMTPDEVEAHVKTGFLQFQQQLGQQQQQGMQLPDENPLHADQDVDVMANPVQMIDEFDDDDVLPSAANDQDKPLTTDTMYQRANLDLRQRLAGRLTPVEVKNDIQAILMELLRRYGLLHRSAADESGKKEEEPKSGKEELPQLLPDDDISMNPVDGKAKEKPEKRPSLKRTMAVMEADELGPDMDGNYSANHKVEPVSMPDLKRHKSDSLIILDEDGEEIGGDPVAEFPLLRSKSLDDSALKLHVSNDHASGNDAPKKMDSSSMLPESKVEMKSSLEPVPLSDQDFIYNALYHPDQWKPLRSAKSKRGRPRQRMIFGVSPDQLLDAPLPMGVDDNDQLAAGIRHHLLQVITPYIGVDGLVQLSRVLLPPVDTIPDDLVPLYIEEFSRNERMWGTENSLAAYVQETDAEVHTHMFDHLGTRIGTRMINNLGGGPQIHIFESGRQTHFQIMIGPFPDNFIVAAHPALQPADVAMHGNADQTDDDFALATFLQDEDLDMFPALPSKISDKGNSKEKLPESSLADSFPDFSDKDLSHIDDLAFLHGVARILGDNPALMNHAAFFEELFRAMAVLGEDYATPEEAAALINRYRQGEQGKMQSAQENNRNYSPTLVPMAGAVGELLTKYQLPLNEILKLMEHVRIYVGFHQKKASWKEKEAPERIEALKAIAKQLNAWSEEYKIPELYRGPSVAEFSAIPSLLSPDGVQGESMRAMLSIDPGNLVGSEPEDFEAWQVFNDELRGFVRAHLLNKHVGGPGIPENLSFISSRDNLRMSELGEEDVKRMVIEQNKQVFYKVGMPRGVQVSDDTYLDEQYSGSIASQVHMYASEIARTTEKDGMNSFAESPEILSEKYGKRDGVLPNDGGGIRFHTFPPDPELITQAQAHWTKVRKSMREKARTITLERYLQNPQVGITVTRAQERLLAIQDPDKMRAHLQELGVSLNGLGVSADDIKIFQRQLGSAWRKNTAESKAEVRGKKSQEKRMDVSKGAHTKGQKLRKNELAPLGLSKNMQVRCARNTGWFKRAVELGPVIAAEEFGNDELLLSLLRLRKQRFELYVKCRAQKLNHAAAMKVVRTKGDASKAMQGQLNKLQGLGIHKYFGSKAIEPVEEEIADDELFDPEADEEFANESDDENPVIDLTGDDEVDTDDEEDEAADAGIYDEVFGIL